MVPITLLALQKSQSLLTGNGALTAVLQQASAAINPSFPVITPDNILISSITSDLADRNLQMAYPRLCLSSPGLKNLCEEKFRNFSGVVGVNVDVFATSEFIDRLDTWIHFYCEAICQLLRTNVGDWGNGLFFDGRYDLQLQSAKPGGIGFVQSARVSISLSASKD